VLHRTRGHLCLPSLIDDEPPHPLAAAILGIARIAQGAPRLLVVERIDLSFDVLGDDDGIDACSGIAWPLRDLLRELILAARTPIEVREAIEGTRSAALPPACRRDALLAVERTRVPGLLRETLARTRARIVAGEIAREP